MCLRLRPPSPNWKGWTGKTFPEFFARYQWKINENTRKALPVNIYQCRKAPKGVKVARVPPSEGLESCYDRDRENSLSNLWHCSPNSGNPTHTYCSVKDISISLLKWWGGGSTAFTRLNHCTKLCLYRASFKQSSFLHSFLSIVRVFIINSGVEN